jgi:hypothetical protein
MTCSKIMDGLIQVFQGLPSTALALNFTSDDNIFHGVTPVILFHYHIKPVESCFANLQVMEAEPQPRFSANMCVCVCVCMYVYVCVFMCVYVGIWFWHCHIWAVWARKLSFRRRMRPGMYICMHIIMYNSYSAGTSYLGPMQVQDDSSQMHKYSCIHPIIHHGIHAYTHTSYHTSLHTCIYTYIHHCIRTCTHTYIPAWPLHIWLYINSQRILKT